MKGNFKSNKGITLIALVVTIIVIIILAGMSISLLFGDNGILSKTRYSKEKILDSKELENVNLAVAAAFANSGENLKIVTEDLEKELKNVMKNEYGNLTGKGPWIYVGQRNTYEIDEKGTITIMDADEVLQTATLSLEIGYGEDGKPYVTFNASVDNSLASISYQINDSDTWTEIENGGVLTNVTYGDTVYGMLKYKNENTNFITSVTIPFTIESGNAGLYDEYGILVASWSDLVDEYGLNIIEDYSDSEYESEPSSLYSVINDNNLLLGTQLVLDDSVSRIGKNSLEKCNLTSITIPKETCIGFLPFSSNRNLKSVKYLGTLKEWINLPKGPLGVMGYADYNLYIDGALITDLVIPEGVTTIGEYSFWNCDSITSLTCSSNLNTIEYGAFASCSNLVNVDFQSNLNSIGDSAFHDCINITSITIPDSVTSIGPDAFQYCLKMEELKIGNGITVLEDGVFNTCQGLTEVVIPYGVTNIGDNTFADNFRLTSVTIPNTVTSIGSYAFGDCKAITSVTIPNSVTTIGEIAFKNVPIIVYGGTATGGPWEAKKWYAYEENGIYYSDTALTTIAYTLPSVSGEITIPASVTTVKNAAFNNTTQITKVNYQGTVEQWCNITFENYNPVQYSKDLYINNSLVTDLVIPNSVTTIKERTFTYCESITNVTIPDSVTSIEQAAFSNCTGLKSVTIPNSVTTIGWAAFVNCTSLTNVTISNSVTTIESYAFSECTSLKSVTIPNNVTTIESYTFSECTGLESVTIPNSVTTIEKYAFNECSNLESITIPNSVTTIESNAFYKIPLVIYSGTATGKPWGAEECAGYEENGLYYTDSSKTKLSGCSSAFTGTLVVPETVELIVENAFYDNDNITAVSMPPSLKAIGPYAFYGCDNLTQADFFNTSWYICWDSTGMYGDKYELNDSYTNAEYLTSEEYMYYDHYWVTSLNEMTAGNYSDQNGNIYYCSYGEALDEANQEYYTCGYDYIKECWYFYNWNTSENCYLEYIG